MGIKGGKLGQCCVSQGLYIDEKNNLYIRYYIHHLKKNPNHNNPVWGDQALKIISLHLKIVKIQPIAKYFCSSVLYLHVKDFYVSVIIPCRSCNCMEQK